MLLLVLNDIVEMTQHLELISHTAMFFERECYE